uniref:Uncharacterized protein n=1 Tax=Poecilia reticulata TaxID=8081 RepID=A0A3P9QEF9_POERE
MAGLRQQSQPDLGDGDGVRAWLLPEREDELESVWRSLSLSPMNRSLLLLARYLFTLKVNLSASFSREREYSFSISPRRRR